jgi:hypothetical protein
VLVALLVVLGVDLVVVLALALLVVGHNRWLNKQPGEFAGAIRVSSGEIHGLRSKWTRGSGRWVRDLLVWNGAPLRLRAAVIGVDQASDARSAHTGEVKHVGEHPLLLELTAGGAVIEMAAEAGDHDRLTGQAQA